MRNILYYAIYIIYNSIFIYNIRINITLIYNILIQYRHPPILGNFIFGRVFFYFKKMKFFVFIFYLFLRFISRDGTGPSFWECQCGPGPGQRGYEGIGEL